LFKLWHGTADTREHANAGNNHTAHR